MPSKSNHLKKYITKKVFSQLEINFKIVHPIKVALLSASLVIIAVRGVSTIQFSPVRSTFLVLFL